MQLNTASVEMRYTGMTISRNSKLLQGRHKNMKTVNLISETTNKLFYFLERE
jgi:hypothetical protein